MDFLSFYSTISFVFVTEKFGSHVLQGSLREEPNFLVGLHKNLTAFLRDWPSIARKINILRLVVLLCCVCA